MGQNKIRTQGNMATKPTLFLLYELPYSTDKGHIPLMVSATIQMTDICALFSRHGIHPSIQKLSWWLYFCSALLDLWWIQGSPAGECPLHVIWVIFSSQIGTSTTESHSLRWGLHIVGETESGLQPDFLPCRKTFSINIRKQMFHRQGCSAHLKGITMAQL